MDGNKDEAARCVQIAVGVLRSGDKQRALKFIRIAQRLDRDVPIGDFLAVLEDLDHSRVVGNGEEFAKDLNGEKSYGDEHVKLIRDIKKKKDYYSILGVGRSCSAEEIKKAYRKLSLKVHPDKNRAPGAEEAFKIVCKAFNCLSDEESRRCYDRVGHIGDDVFGCEDDYVRRMRRRSRRRATPADGHAFDDYIDPNEFFRNFMHGMKDDVFQVRRARKTREVPDQHRELNGHRGVFTLVVIFQIMLIMICLLFVYLPYSEPQYALQKTYAYHIPMVMEKHDVEFFVKSEDFEEQFPRGSATRVELEKKVLRDYKGVLSRYCHLELQRRRWVKDKPKPHCDRLRSLAVA